MLQRAIDLIKEIGKTIKVRDMLMQEFSISKVRADSIYAKALRTFNKRK